jgi:hypothetical protein
MRKKTKLYHGTNIRYLDTILKQGLTPRQNTEGEKKGNFTISPSHQDMVYMSTAYPWYYAVMAHEITKGDLTKGVVFEIDTVALDESNYYPDEDFVWQVMKEKISGLKHPDIRENLTDYQDMWKDSLKHSGCICHKGTIPVSAITRYCVFDFEKRANVGYEMLQPKISIENYNVAGEKYIKLNKWCFGDIDELPFLSEAKAFCESINNNGSEKTMQSLYDHWKRCVEFWTPESMDRTGIEVVKLR